MDCSERTLATRGNIQSHSSVINLLTIFYSSILEEGDSSLPTEPPTPPTRTSEALRADLQKVNAQLSSMKKAWEEETRRLLGENVVLQDAATRLNAQVRDAQNEARRLAETERAGEKARVGIQGVCTRALYKSRYNLTCLNRNSIKRSETLMNWRLN